MSHTENQDEQLVRQVVESYIAGSYEADINKLQSIFSPSATMNGYLGEDLVESRPEIYFQDLASKPSLKETGADLQTSIDYLSVKGDIASVVLVLNGFGLVNFTDYFHLVKKEGKWLITSKTFTTF